MSAETPESAAAVAPDPAYAPARTPLGADLRRLRAKIIESGEPLLSREAIEREVADRRGGVGQAAGGVLTYVDAGVLIAAARGRSAEANRALAVLDDAAREFAASDFLRLEVLPKAIYNKRQAEAAFYERFFQGVKQWAAVSQALLDSARAVATEHGLAAMDAVHIAAAEALGVAQFVTGEKREKPLFRVKSVPIWSLHG